MTENGERRRGVGVTRGGPVVDLMARRMRDRCAAGWPALMASATASPLAHSQRRLCLLRHGPGLVTDRIRSASTCLPCLSDSDNPRCIQNLLESHLFSGFLKTFVACEHSASPHTATNCLYIHLFIFII